jgi:aspartate kinase
MIVMKFGGSSLRDAERIAHVTAIIRQQLGRKPILVISALGSTTDNLIRAGEAALKGTVNLDEVKGLHLSTVKQLGLEGQTLDPLFAELENLLRGISLLKEFSKKTRDHLVSFGERLAVRILAAHLTRVGIPARHLDAWDLGLLTNSNFGDAEVIESSYDNLSSALAAVRRDYSYTPVITGFIARDALGNITTLGRGGTDLTASLVGAALTVEEIQVWKDVDGILTTDPRLAPAARPVPSVSFEEASELAYFGAKVLHPLSMQPAMSKNIPVRVKNSYNPEHPGTLIAGTADGGEGAVKAITCKRRVTLIDIVSSRMLGQYGFLAGVFQIFNQSKLSVDMVATSEVSVSLTLNQDSDLAEVTRELEKIARVSVSRGKAILSIVGDVSRSSEILDATFHILNRNGINVQMISQGASKVNIGLIVEDAEVETCVRELHRHFFEIDKIAA